MKYFTRLKKYKASNVEYDLNTGKAWSYGWWCFYDHKTGIFNNTTYSNSTSKHQDKVYMLLDYKVDLMLKYTLESLTDLQRALEDEYKNVVFEIEKLETLIKKPRTRKSTNEKRKNIIKNLNNHLTNVKVKYESIFGYSLNWAKVLL